MEAEHPSDCADVAMTAVTHSDDASARAAYACLGAGMRTSSEDAFVAGMRQNGVPDSQFDRVAEKRLADGSRVVFYTVEGAGSPPMGYIVYLDKQGKISRVE